MPITTIDPKTALLIIDLQRGIVAMPAAHPMEEVIANAAALAAAFRSRGLPVVLVNVAAPAPGRTETPPRVREMPAGWTEFVPELDRQAGDHTITKRSWGAFTNTGLEQFLRGHGVTQVVVAGVATSAGVESTARQSHELGFHVTLAIDAMTDMNLDAHTNSVLRIFPRMSETGTTQQILSHLAAHPD